MSSSQNLVGKQTPRIRVVQPYEKTEGGNVEKVARVLGIILDEWQKNCLDDWMALDIEDRYLHTRCGLSVPRQNGKTATVEARILFGTLFKGERILYTAHEHSTMAQLFDRMKEFFGEKANDPNATYPDLNKRVARVRGGAGKEAIFLKNGAVIYFATRTNKARRGFTVDIIICDEAQSATDQEMKALLPTSSAAPSGDVQYIYIGTPPDALTGGDIFGAVREDALSGLSFDLTWSEWSVEEVGDIRDETRWYNTNPGLGIRLLYKAVVAELGTFTDPISFAQERLGYWLKKTSKAIVASKSWGELAVKEAPESGKIAYGVKISPDGNAVTLAAAILPSNKVPHVECIETRALDEGLSWLAKWLIERQKTCATVVFDGQQGAITTLIELLREGGFPKLAITEPKTANMTNASSMMLNRIEEKTVTHLSQPRLTDSVTNASKRIINKNSGAWGWGGDDSTPIEAASLAVYGVITTKRKPGKKSRLQ